MLGGLTVSQLRWTLLILGGVFIAALALWERLRPRQARGRDSGAHRAAQEPALGGLPAETRAPAGQRGEGEPWIGEVPLGEELPAAESWREAAPSEPLADLPTVLIDEPEEAPAPIPQPGALDTAATDEWEALEEGVGPVRIIGHGAPAAPAAVQHPAEQEEAAPSEPPELLAVPPGEPELRVEWPAESARRIIALRLIAGEERFSGRTLRLALTAEGFRLGRFDIFHKPDESGRAVLSVASLTRPGTFDLDAMDAQRYAGLNLFTVLPGPLPPEQALEALLAAADHLNERLQGEVQDERGEPLTGESLARLRAALPEGPGEALS